MPFGGLLSLAGPLMGGGSALAGLLGGNPASKVHLPQGYSYGNQGGADAGAYGGIGGLGQYNVAAGLLPQYQQIAQQAANNPFAPGFQQGSQTAGNYGIASGINAFNAGGSLTSGALGMMPDVQALLSMGFDPQNALYSKLQQQNTDQTRAGLAARGMVNSPYGQGQESQSNQNFNLGWQNNLLSRASQGAGAAGQLLGQIGSGVGGGQALQAGAPQQIMQGAGMPYGTFEQINSDALRMLSGLGQFGQSAAQIPQQQIGDYLQYLSGATGQQGANNQTAGLGLQQANMGFNQNQILGGQFGSALSGLGKAYQGWGSPTPASMQFASTGGYSPSQSFGWG